MKKVIWNLEVVRNAIGGGGGAQWAELGVKDHAHLCAGIQRAERGKGRTHAISSRSLSLSRFLSLCRTASAERTLDEAVSQQNKSCSSHQHPHPCGQVPPPLLGARGCFVCAARAGQAFTAVTCFPYRLSPSSIPRKGPAEEVGHPQSQESRPTTGRFRSRLAAGVGYCL